MEGIKDQLLAVTRGATLRVDSPWPTDPSDPPRESINVIRVGETAHGSPIVHAHTVKWSLVTGISRTGQYVTIHGQQPVHVLMPSVAGAESLLQALSVAWLVATAPEAEAR
jgi:hypothetical protein